MCFDAKNNPITGVRNSDFGYDVILQDGTMGNVANSPGSQGYDEVQAYLAKSAPSPTAEGPKPGLPNGGGLSLSQIGGTGNGPNGIRGMSQINDGGGRYGIGTAQRIDAEGNIHTIDQAPPTPGNIAQAIGNVLGFPSSIASMALTQSQSLSDGPLAGAIDGALGGASKNEKRPASTGSLSTKDLNAQKAAQVEASRGRRDHAVNVSRGGATAEARAAGAYRSADRGGGRPSGGGRGSDAGMGRGTGTGKY